MSLCHRLFNSPAGQLKLVSNDYKLSALLWPCERVGRVSMDDSRMSNDDPILNAASEQLDEYFAGERKCFDVPLSPSGTAFQVEVWNGLREIAWGETISYRTLAARIGRPKAVRAVGAAIGRNPISIIIPCHRVIGASGELTGFAGGLDTKRALLDLELFELCRK